MAHTNRYYPYRSTAPGIASPQAWEISRGSSNVVAALLDPGIDARLWELEGRALNGYSFTSNSTNPMDGTGHVTKMATILAANANNRRDGAGSSAEGGCTTFLSGPNRTRVRP